MLVLYSSPKIGVDPVLSITDTLDETLPLPEPAEGSVILIGADCVNVGRSDSAARHHD